MIKKFPIAPGVDRQRTKHSVGQNWYDVNNMRFQDIDPESVGGWERIEQHELYGIGRGIYSWMDFSDIQYICVGTSYKFYLLVGSDKYDITPVRLQRTGSQLTDPFTADGSTSIVQVTDVGHGANINDFVVFRTIVDATVGGVASTVFTSEVEGFQVASVIDDDNYTFDLGVVPTIVDTVGGDVEVDYLIRSGTSSDASGSGWGVGTFGGDDVFPTVYTLAATPITTFIGSPNIEIEMSGVTPSPANDFAVGDYIYLDGLTGTFDDVDLTYLNGKWWEVSSIDGDTPPNPTIVGVQNGTAGASGGGGSAGTFYFDDVSEAEPVVGAERGWGTPSSSSLVVDTLRSVTIQNFGEDLVVNNRGGPLYYYDTSANVSSGIPADNTPAIEISEANISGATDPPDVMDFFIISESHGHVIAFVCNDIDDPGNKNNLLIRWSHRHNPFVWFPTESNEAGGRVLREGSEILGAVNTKDEIVVFTNTALYSMRYVGYPEVYGFNLVTRTAGLYARGSAAAVDNRVFFMGRDQFYVYDGSVQPLSRNMVSYVFDDINESQRDKCFSGVNSKFTEVIWFYPSADSFEPNKWVSFNYSNGTWSSGSFDMSAVTAGMANSDTNNRTSWIDLNILNNPMSTYITSYDPTTSPETALSSVFLHESGTSGNGSAIAAHAETGRIDISEGDMYVHYDRILPDIELFNETGEPSAEITLSIRGQDLPGRSETQVSTVTVDFEELTTDDALTVYAPEFNETSIRGRARTISFKAESSSSGYQWKLGQLRLGLKPDGRR